MVELLISSERNKSTEMWGGYKQGAWSESGEALIAVGDHGLVSVLDTYGIVADYENTEGDLAEEFCNLNPGIWVIEDMKIVDTGGWTDCGYEHDYEISFTHRKVKPEEIMKYLSDGVLFPKSPYAPEDGNNDVQTELEED